MEVVQRAFEECRPWMYPVLGVSIVVLAVVVERTVTFVARWGVRGDLFLTLIEKLVRQGNLDRALKVVKALGPNVPIGRVVQEGLLHAEEGIEGVRHAMDEAIRQARPLLRRRLFPLLGLGTATLALGVLGTHQLGGFSPPPGVATPLPFDQPMAMAPLMAGAAVAAVATFAFLVFFLKAGTIERHLNEARERLPGLFAGRERGAGGQVEAPAPPEAAGALPRLGHLGLSEGSPPDRTEND